MMKKNGYDEANSPASICATVLGGLDAYVYVSDAKTREILFVNDKLKEYLRLGGEVEGNVCWQTLRAKRDGPCGSCPIGRLLSSGGAPATWEEQDARTGRFFRNFSRIITWPDGRPAHLVHATDITDTKRAFDRRLRQQEVMSNISQSFTTAENTRDLFYKALKTAGEFMGVDHAFLSKYREEGGYLECLHEWYRDGGTPYIGKESRWPLTPDMDIYAEFSERGYAAVNDYRSLVHPNFAAVKARDLRAFLNITIKISGEFWGVIGFIINKRVYAWSESDIHLGKLIAGVFSGAVSRGIMEEDLYKAKEEAEQASKAKGEFLSSMSHEIRTPLNAIIGMTQIARSSGDSEKMAYCLERIDSASSHLLGLLNDILDISKIEANRLELTEDEFDFEKMLMNVVGVVNFRVEAKKQNLMINIDSDVPPVFIGDEMRLSQVIVNLLTNAVKFTPDGGTVSVNAHNAEATDGEGSLRIEVIDNGIGISKEQQARLFSPFKQADGGIARKYGGTGLGLTISKGIVELMGGRIWIESELGQGAKFNFLVKLKAGMEPCHPKLSDAIDKDSIRVLAVVSVPETSEYIARVMDALKLSCDMAGSGALALNIIEKNADTPYNVIFVDGTLPDMESMRLVREIRRQNRQIAIVMIISEVEWSSKEKEAVEAGVSSFVFKPLFPSRLVNAVNESMGMTVEGKQNAQNALCYDFRGSTILVAEDVEINREIIAAVLEDTNITIDFAENGAEALAMFEGDPERYNLILTDIQMPEMDGYEATQRIRALDTRKARTIPIIAMTANVFREDIDRCLEAGMNDHIGKPVSVDALLVKLNAYLRAQKEGYGA